MKRCRTPGEREGDRHFRVTRSRQASKRRRWRPEKGREVTRELARLPRRWHVIYRLVSIFSPLSLPSDSLKSADTLTVRRSCSASPRRAERWHTRQTTQISRDLPRFFNLLGSACSPVGG